MRVEIEETGVLHRKEIVRPSRVPSDKSDKQGAVEEIVKDAIIPGINGVDPEARIN